ncbi:MAG: hypothetical protein HY043_08800 [Verrucomicrobia bacterium]|nr:hypothetical protein [Verrucomicrobiota bacterium]
MPIRINLLAEDQFAEELRRRDPVKRAIWISSAVVALVLAWSLWLQVKVGLATREQNNYESQWARLEKDFKRVTENLQKTAEIEGKLAALQKLATNRFLWGTPLNSLQHTVAGNVQVTRLRAAQVYQLTEEVKPREQDGRTIPGKPAAATEKIALTIVAKDFGSPTGLQQFKESLAAYPHFKEQLKRVDLTELSAPQADPTDPNRPYVQFTLSCVYPEKTRSK